MNKIYYRILLCAAIFGLFLFPFGILNTMVSLKYETEGGGDCISRITGNDLCQSIVQMKSFLGISALLVLILLIFKRKILKSQN
ncbi:hypothetical protein D3C72_2046690 [compost metagenome]